MSSDKNSWNDAEAFGAWVAENHARLIAIVEQKLGAGLRKKLEPEDLLQDAVGRALRSLSSIDPNTPDPLTWFLQIVDHQIVDAHRYHFGAQKRDASREVSAHAQSSGDAGESPALIDLLVASMTSASQVLSKNVRMERMYQALQQLPDDAQSAIRWRYIEGLPSQVIAERLGKTDGAVRVLLTRTLKKLEQLLGDVRPTS